MWLALPVPGRGVFGRGLVRVSARRCSSLTEEEEEDVDINDRQHPPRSKEFYEENAARRNYFYFMDNRGQLFLEETKRRNMATCMKDRKFLDFTIKNMKPNKTGAFPEMPSVSLCGKELNYIAHADKLSPFTFKSKVDHDDGKRSLVYAGALEQHFHPELLAFHPGTGRIYHRITKHRHYKDAYGLLHPHLCLELSENMSHSEAENTYSITIEGSMYPLKLMD